MSTPGEEETTVYTAICHSPGCANAGIAIAVGPPTQELEGLGTVAVTYSCGVCGQIIDDVEHDAAR